jgi:hypothetical protein
MLSHQAIQRVPEEAEDRSLPLQTRTPDKPKRPDALAIRRLCIVLRRYARLSVGINAAGGHRLASFRDLRRSSLSFLDRPLFSRVRQPQRASCFLWCWISTTERPRRRVEASEDFTLTVAVRSFWACCFHDGAVCVEFRLVIVRIAAVQRSTVRAERAGAILRLCSFSSGSQDVTVVCAVTIVRFSYRLPSTSRLRQRIPSRPVPKTTTGNVRRELSSHSQ